MKISNPIFKELIKLKIINKSNLIKISNQTRDKKIPVYKDQKSKVIFLEKYITDTKYYEAVKYKDNSRKNKKRTIVNIKTLKGSIKTSKLDDDKRRVLQFKKLLRNKKILDEKFKSLNVIDNNIVFSCGSSVTASVLGVAYSLINNKYMPIIYIGSWSEYGKE